MQGTLKKAFTQRLYKRTREKEEKPFKKRWLAEVFGISRQGYYKRMKHLETQAHQYELILSKVRKIRKLQPKYGTLKVFKELSFFFHQQGIKMGRDRFFKLLKWNGMLVKKSKNFVTTTNSKHSSYENAVAERMNRTLKYEYGLKETLPDLKTAQKMTQQAVNLYNNHRLHFSLNFQTPAKVHLKENVKYKSYKRKKC